ncbi:hypothetical protein V8E36_008535 [Tilletia maclaganii]
MMLRRRCVASAGSASSSSLRKYKSQRARLTTSLTSPLGRQLYHLFTGLNEQGKHGLGYARVHSDQVLVRFQSIGCVSALGGQEAPLRSGRGEPIPASVFTFPNGTMTISQLGDDESVDMDHQTSAGAGTARSGKAKVKVRKGDGKVNASRPALSTSTSSLSISHNDEGGFAHQVVLRQDFTAFRSVSGNTGSVAWRSSLALSAVLLQDLHVASQPRMADVETALLSRRALFSPGRITREWTILELGAGTGVLSSLVLTHPALQQLSSGTRLRWIVTDQGEVYDLLERNVDTTNRCVAGARDSASEPQIEAIAHELDWIQVHKLSQREDERSRRHLDQLKRGILLPPGSRHDEAETIQPPDLILVVDCIFNTALFPSLLATLRLYGGDPRTQVLISCEIREVDMMRAFLEAWVEGDQGRQQAHPGWDIRAWHGCDRDDQQSEGLGSGFVLWLATLRQGGQSAAA